MSQGRSASILVSLLCLVLPARLAVASGEFDRATRLSMVGDYEGSIQEYEDFLERHPEHRLAPLAALAAGNLHIEIWKDYDRAAEKFDRVITDYRLSAWAPEAARRKGETLQALEDWEVAGEAFEQALGLAVEGGNAEPARWVNEVTANAADCYYRLGDHDKVLETYERILQEAPAPEVSAAALYRMGEAYETKGDPEKAARRYVEVLEDHPCGSGEVFAQVLRKRDLIDRHVEFDWRPYEAYDDAYQLYRQRDLAAAVARCEDGEAATDNPNLLECLEYRKIRFETMASGDHTGGCRRLSAHHERYPEGQLAGRVEEVLESWSDVVEAEALAAENPDDPMALFTLGSQYYFARALEPAIQKLERAQQLDPSLEEIHELLGYAYYLVGRSEDAVRELEVYLEDYPDDTRALDLVGNLCVGMEQYDKAATFFERHVEQAPDDAGAYQSLGECLFRAGRSEEAARACERAVELDPNLSGSLFILGQACRQMNRKDEAVQAYERFLEIIPDGEQADQARAALAELRGE